MLLYDHRQNEENFNVLLQNKSEQKVTCNWFCAPIIFENPLKTGFSIRDICTITICVGRVWTVIRYFLFENLLLMDFKGYWYTKKGFSLKDYYLRVKL